jgi:hypothetical protein
MKALFALLSLALPLFIFSASGQVTVDLSLDQDQFLPGEALQLAVHVTNRSGQLIHLGDEDWVTFFVQSDDGSVVVKKSDPPVKDPFSLDSLEVATKRVDLAPYFNLTRPGTYRVMATVHIKDWNTDVTSGAKSFDIIEGAQLWSQTFGVPDSSAPNQPPAVRKYTLVQANYLREQLRLYVQVTDETGGSIFKVRVLGPMISFSQPEAQLDRLSNLHVLCQSGATAFTYSVLNPNGELIQHETYDYVSTHPRLGEDTNGNISVIGGVRRVKPGSAEMPDVKAPDELTR